MEINLIKRPYYIDKINPFIGKPLIKVITGQRRVGKSYLLRQLMEEIHSNQPNANLIYLNMEFHEHEPIRSHSMLYQYVTERLVANVPNFLFIDEVQEIEHFERCLRSLLAEGSCDIYCTGSNANMLSGELATILSGRYVQITVYTLSFQEFLLFHQLPNTNDSLNKYLTLGGLPYLIHTGLDQEVGMEYLRNVNSTILLKDVVARESIRNVSFLENLVAYLADNTGNILSALNISKFLKSQQIPMPTQTVLNYLRALENAFIVHRVQRTDIKGLKIFEIGDKYYFEDLGMRNAIRPFSFRGDINKLMENVVYLHLLRMGYKVFVGNLNGREIDFVAEKNGERLYMQVCYMLTDQSTIDREFGNLLSITDQFPKLVVTLDEINPATSFKGIHQVHLRDFLMNTFSL